MAKIKPDIILKNYWHGNEEFADLFNAVLFNGEQVIRPEELEDVDTEESSILEHRKYAESLQASRDNIKILKKSTELGVIFAMLGLENQERIHFAMPLRIMGYDYSAYKKQYDSNAKKYTSSQGMTQDEYLSKMKKTDKFIPVISLVVYWGEEPWDAARSLHEMLNIPKELVPYVNDYKMLLVEARQNNLTLSNNNNHDLFNLLQIVLDTSLSRNEARQKAIQYSEEHKPDKAVLMAVAGAADMNIDYQAFEEGDSDMCTLFEEIKAEGRDEGRREGILEGKNEGRLEGRLEGRAIEIVQMGREYGLSDDEILKKLQVKLELSLQEAQAYLLDVK